MANYVICEREDLEAIGDIIRQKTNSTEKISLTQMQTQVEDIEPKLQSKTATPSASTQTIKPDSEYNGLSQVTLSGDANLVADNIKSGVSIFGVTGTHEGSSSDGVQIEVMDSNFYVNSTTEGSVLYSCYLSNDVVLSQEELQYFSTTGKYRILVGEVLLKSPIVVLTSGTVTISGGTSYTFTNVASGDGYVIYEASVDDSSDSGDGLSGPLS